MAKNKFSGTLAVFCSDERFVKRTMEFAYKSLGTSICDMIAVPGGPVFIADKEKSLLDGLKFLVKKQLTGYSVKCVFVF